MKIFLIIWACTSIASADSSAGALGSFELKNGNWAVRIVPSTPQISMLSGSEEKIEIAFSTESAPIQNLLKSTNQASWTIPSRGRSAKLILQENRIWIKLDSSREQEFHWPKTGEDSSSQAIACPESEDLLIPVRDKFWLKYAEKNIYRNLNGGLSAPFCGVQHKNVGVTYLLVNDLRSELCLKSKNDTVSAELSHSFLERDHFAPFEMEIILTDNSPVSSALA